MVSGGVSRYARQNSQCSNARDANIRSTGRALSNRASGQISTENVESRGPHRHWSFALRDRPNCLTYQPFLPKLRLTKYMSGNRTRVFFIFLLAILFLAGQFHLCADTSANGFASHTCPFCATAGSAVFTPV